MGDYPITPGHYYRAKDGGNAVKVCYRHGIIVWFETGNPPPDAIGYLREDKFRAQYEPDEGGPLPDEVVQPDSEDEETDADAEYEGEWNDMEDFS